MSKDKTSKIEKRQNVERENVERENVERQNVEITKRSKDPKVEIFRKFCSCQLPETKKEQLPETKNEKLHEIQFCIFTIVKTLYKLVKREKKRRPNLT
jgi:hypothetical protein